MKSAGPLLAAFPLWMLLASSCAELQQSVTVDDILSGQGAAGGALSERTVADGLKEALEFATERAVAQTSRSGGFSENPLLRIALPEQLDSMAQALRTVGLGSQVDSLERSMNRAAERATGEAKGVFWNAVSAMTIQDAFSILQGGDTAATDYFRVRTESELRERFDPIVSDAMGQVGLYRVYEDLLGRYNRLPLTQNADVDLESYVTGKTLDGLFLVLGDEERQIRENPTARTTDLLRRVFGSGSRAGSS